MITIKEESLNDHTEIESLVYQAFLNHPHHAPGAKPTEHLIINALRRTNGLHLSLVACKNNRICGHIAFSEVKVDDKSVKWYGLGPLAVLPSLQQQGIGRALIEAGMDKLRKEGALGVVLVGDPAYYSRFGFYADARLQYKGIPAEYFLIHAFSNDIPSGSVTYHPGFYEAE